MRSLQGRLSAGLLGGLIAVFALQWFLVSLAIHRVTENYVASQMEHDLDALLAALAFDANGAPRLAGIELNPIYHQPFSGHYYHVAVVGRVFRSRSLWDRELTVPPLALGAVQRLHQPGPLGQELLMVVRSYRKQDVPVTIAAATDLSPIKQDIQGFQLRYAVLTVGVLAALLVLQRLTIRRALRPLDAVTANLARLEQGEAQQLNDAVPAEIGPLVREVNHLLDVTRQRLVRSRTALGNLAHALKTPLTLLMQSIDSKDLEPHAELRAHLRTQAGALRQVLERELKRARLAGEVMPGMRFVPEQELPPLVDALRRIHQDKALDIQCRIPPGLVFGGDREDMLELIGNLLDNACKWARSRVRLCIEPAPGLNLSIEDDGPGCPPEQLARLARRGVRLDESTVGHGLGLAIVRDIVEQYGGRLKLGRSEDLGGLAVRVILPSPGFR